ncbi:MAG: hypothetical protein MZV65_16270 [Chromatiales bacterium]|nr:hypothetical protein [Chromatiales bacterium]
MLWTSTLVSSSGFVSLVSTPALMQLSAREVIRNAITPRFIHSGLTAIRYMSTVLGFRSARRRWNHPKGRSDPRAFWRARDRLGMQMAKQTSFPSESTTTLRNRGSTKPRYWSM